MRLSNVYIRQVLSLERDARKGRQRERTKRPNVNKLKMEDKDTIETEVIFKAREKTHPDGGYGWFVVFSGFAVQFIAVGLQNSSGTIFSALIDEFQRSKGETAWVGSLGIGVMFFCGPLTTTLCEKYGCRIVGCVGAVLCVFGLVMSSFATSLEIMFVTYGVTWGLGASFCYFPTLIILVEYFEKRLALVNGFVSSGSGLGTLVISPFSQYILLKVGLFHSLRILALVNALSFVCALTFKPVAQNYALLQRKNKEKCLQKGGSFHGNSGSKRRVKPIWREKSYIAWTIALSTFMMGYFVPFVHLKRHAVLLGVPDEKASFLIGILSITSTIGKVFAGKIADNKRVNILYMYQAGLLTMSISTTLLPLGTGYQALVAYALIFGLAEACFVVLIPLVTKEIVGIGRLSPALGSLFMIMSVPTMVGPPVAGWLYDASGSYAVAFYVAGGFMAAGVCLIFFIPFCAEKPDQNDEEIKVLTRAITENTNPEDPEDKHPLQEKDEKPGTDYPSSNNTDSDLFSRNSRFCIFPCLPTRSRRGIEEGKYCKENENDTKSNDGNDVLNIHMIDKVSAI